MLTIFESIEFEEPIGVSVSLRQLVAPTNAAAFRVWEADDNLAIFYDFWNIDLDADGYYWFDSNVEPDVTEAPYFLVFSSSSVFHMLWLFWDLEVQDSYMLSASSRFSGMCYRRKRIWKAAFGNLRVFFSEWLQSVLVLHIISLHLVGVGYSCELSESGILRILVSNTNDLLIEPPFGIKIGLRPGSSDYADRVGFFFYSPDYQLVRLYSTFVRNTVRFNIYEYQGLLFSGEKKIKKLTKQKQK